MSDVQKDELNFIKIEFEEALDNIGLSTKHHSIAKTESGYTFSRRCKQNDCRAPVNLKLNVSTEMGTISFEENCKKHK